MNVNKYENYKVGSWTDQQEISNRSKLQNVWNFNAVVAPNVYWSFKGVVSNLSMTGVKVLSIVTARDSCKTERCKCCQNKLQVIPIVMHSQCVEINGTTIIDIFCMSDFKSIYFSLFVFVN